METVLPKRKSHHLQGYDYSQNGAYFITICTHQRRMLFGPNRDPRGGIVQAFKRYSTVEYIRLVKSGQAAPFNKHLWQRSFHDHVVRNETDYRMIAEYIDTNPRLWHKDCFYEEPSHEP